MSKALERPTTDRSFKQISAAAAPGVLLKTFTDPRPSVAERMRIS